MHLIYSFIFMLLLLSTSCRKVQPSNPNSKALGHGGMGISNTLPINSYESLYKCLAIGADGVEFDLQLSKDSVWVIFHDEDLSHSTNMSGQIHDHIWSYMKDAYYQNPIYASYGLINADEFLENISNKEQFVFSLDLKNYKPNTTDGYTKTLAERYVQFVHKHNLATNSYVSTSNLLLLETIDSLDANIDVYIYSGNLEVAMTAAIDKNLDGITIHIELLSKDLVDKAHSAGLKVATFGLNSSQANADALEFGVDFIETDQLQNLLQL